MTGDIPAPPRIEVEGLDMAFGDNVVQRNLHFAVASGSIFTIMGGSGCGKSTLLRHMIGLIEPARGRVAYDGIEFWPGTPAAREHLLQRMGVMFQNGALWSSRTLAENVAVPLQQSGHLSERDINLLARAKLALVGLRGFEDYAPSEISGGMRKRAAIARAIALDPPILFLDEPSAGLDPLTARRLDDLIRDLRDSLGTTIVIVTHELASIFAIADDSIMLDAVSKTAIAWGNPVELRDHSDDARVRAFLTRGEVALPGAAQ